MSRNRRMVRSGILMLWCFSVYSLGACTAGPPSAPLPAGSCPELSGRYWYPGTEKAATVCADGPDASFGPDLALVVPSRGQVEPGARVANGGWRQIEAATNVEIRQNGCASLTFFAPFSYPYHRDNLEQVLANLAETGTRYEMYPDTTFPDYVRFDIWHEKTLYLDPTLPGAALDWGPDFLTYRFRFRAAGFGAGLARNFLTLTLRKLDDGALLYHLVHEEKPGGVSHEIECRLPAAGGGGGE